MSKAVTIRTRKFMRNALLQRRQFVIDVLHPGRANVSKSDLADELVKSHKCKKENVIMFGFRTQFGGGRSTGFCLIYDNQKALVKFTPAYMQVRFGIGTKKESSRKQIKESKNRGLKSRGTGVALAKHKAKRAANSK